jgi:hypothetical protein
MKTRFLPTCLCALFLTGSSCFGLFAEANSPLKFKPPSRSRPKITIGAASRESCLKAMPDETKFTALVPQNGLGLTTAKQPTLMVYLPQHEGKALQVKISPIVPGKKTTDPNQLGQDLYVKLFQVPINDGLVRLNLNDPNLPELEIGKQYLWEVGIVCETKDNIFGEIVTTYRIPTRVGGVIERIRPSTSLSQSLNRTTADQLPQVYAEAGIWHEAVDSLQNLRRSQPHNSNLHRDWESLMQSIGQTSLSQKPLAECCQVDIAPPKLP